MKKYLFLIVVVFLTGCAFTQQQKAERLVKKYLLEHLNDAKSYESVNFSKLELICYAYEDTIPEGIALKNKETEYKSQHNEAEAKKIRKTLDSIDFIYPNPIVKSYVIEHKYRAKNGFGAMILSNSRFVLNPSLDTVIDVQDNSR
jgi:hypothetical protein